MASAGQVVYSSSSRSPISVSASSATASTSASSSPFIDGRDVRRRDGGTVTPAHQRGAAPSVPLAPSSDGESAREIEDGLICDQACALVYVTPSTTHQFVSVSGAAAFLRSQTTTTAAAEPALKGGYWRLGYVVYVSSTEPNEEPHRALHRSCWCFTLEPLPVEQLTACRAVLAFEVGSTTPAPSSPSTTHGRSAGRDQTHSHHRHHHHRQHHHHTTHAVNTAKTDALLNDLLVTPLYVCTTASAVVELTGNGSCGGAASPVPQATLSELLHCAAGWPVLDLLGSLQSLVQAVPSPAVLAYALRQCHRFHLPPLQLVGHPITLDDEEEEPGTASSAWTSRDAAVDVYVTLGDDAAARCTSTDADQRQQQQQRILGSLSPQETEEKDEDARRAWPSLARGIALRGGRNNSTYQTLLFQGCARTGQRLRRNVVAELGGDDADSSSPPTLAKLRAALRILDALTPSTESVTGEAQGRSAVVVNSLDVYVQRTVSSPRNESTEMLPPAALRVVGGKVRRLVSVAGAEAAPPAPPSSPKAATAAGADAHIAPEADVLVLPWFASRNECQKSRAARIADRGPAALLSKAVQADMETCMRTLHMSDELRAHLNDLTEAILLVASLTFSTRHGTTASANEAALLSAAAVPACEAASRLLRLSSSLDLVQLLTSVEVRSGACPDTVRHALNCAGACQLQSVLVAHLGGVLVRTLLQAVNDGLREDVELCSKRELSSGGGEAGASSCSVVSLVVTTADVPPGKPVEEETDDTEGGAGVGLQEWYAAYVRHRVACAVWTGLVGNLQQEARCEGVEREVDTWVDALRTNTAVAEFLPHPYAAPAASQLDGLAAAVDAVVGACCGKGNGVDDSVASTPAAVQRLLQEAFAELVEGDVEEEERETGSADGDKDDEAEKASQGAASGEGRETTRRNRSSESKDTVRFVWATRRPSSEEQRNAGKSAVVSHDKTCLCVVLTSNPRAPLHLSLSRLAADILSAVRLRRIGATAAVQRVVTAVAVRSASLLPSSLEEEASNDDRRGAQNHPAENVESMWRKGESATTGNASSVTQALTHALTLPPSCRDNAAYTTVASHTSSSLTFVQVIPVTTDAAHAASSSLSPFPFLEPIVPPSSCDVPETVDDAATQYLQRTEPLWLALLCWDRLCHSQVLPVVPFGRECAAPLLTAYALQPTAPRTPAASPNASVVEDPSNPLHAVPPRPRPTVDLFCGGYPAGEGGMLLHRVHALRSQARYRELTLLALATVPLCHTAVLGVSCVFLSTTTAAEVVAWRAAVLDAAVRCLQRVGRGCRSRQTVAEAAQQARASRDDPAAAPSHARTPSEVQARAAFEQQRTELLKQTSTLRTSGLHTAAAHLSNAVGTLQQRWTTALELLEAELAAATAEINAFETQRRAAEDASRQAARTNARVTAEAWADVWADDTRRRQHRRAVQLAEQRREQRRHAALSSQEAATAARLREETRLAEITVRHLARLHRNAAQSAEAALLARAVADRERSDAQWLRQHVQRQEHRLRREAALRATAEVAQPLARQSARDDSNAASDSSNRGHKLATTPIRQSNSAAAATTASPLLQYSDARGLVFTRPRPVSREAMRRAAPVDRTRVFSPGDGQRGRVGHVPIASIDRTALVNATRSRIVNSDEDGEDEDWAVQRDLMSLWESSRVTT